MSVPDPGTKDAQMLGCECEGFRHDISSMGFRMSSCCKLHQRFFRAGNKSLECFTHKPVNWPTWATIERNGETLYVYFEYVDSRSENYL